MIKKLRNLFYSVLRRSEKYTKTDMVYLAKGGFWLTFGQISNILLTLLLSIAFANLLPKEVYGQYKYVLSIFGILAISNLGGLNIALARSVALGKHGSLEAVFKTKIKWSLLGAGASLAAAAYYFINDNITLTLSFLITAAFVVAVENLRIYLPYLHGMKRFDVMTKYGLAVKVISVLAVIATIYLTDNVHVLLIVLFSSQTLPRLYYYLKTKKRFVQNKEIDKEVLNYGKKLSFLEIITTVANQLDKILVFHYLGAVDLAIYAFAYAPTEHLKSVLKNVQNLAFPKFVEHSKKEIQATLFRKSLKLSAVALVAVIVYILAAPYLFAWFFPQYTDAVIYSQVIALSLVTVPIWVYRSAFTAKKMTSQLYKLDITNSIFQIILTLTLIANFGIWGAVLARFAYRLLNLTLSMILFHKD